MMSHCGKSRGNRPYSTLNEKLKWLEDNNCFDKYKHCGFHSERLGILKFIAVEMRKNGLYSPTTATYDIMQGLKKYFE